MLALEGMMFKPALWIAMARRTSEADKTVAADMMVSIQHEESK
jgi:hypothetical protein